MSDDPRPVTVGRLSLTAGSWFPEHTHPTHQLDWTTSGDPRGLEELATGSGASRRTLSRLFVADTGPAFERWRTHLRIRAALPLLAEGHGIARVAHAVGYASPSAFLAAFRRVVGTTPRCHLRPGRSGPASGTRTPDPPVVGPAS